MNINTSITSGTVPSALLWEQAHVASVEIDKEDLVAQEDLVHVSTSRNGNLDDARLLDDEEAEVVFEETLSMVGGDPVAALNVHSGLDAARVAALLAF